MAINLLPWREVQTKNKILSDFFQIIFFTGSISLMLELGLSTINLYQYYLTSQQIYDEKKILSQKDILSLAVQAQNELVTLKKQVHLQKNSQKGWKEIHQVLKILSNEKPTHIQLTQISFEKKIFLIKGIISKIEVLNQYQKNLQAQGFKVQLKQWKPAVEHNDSSDFELEVTT